VALEGDRRWQPPRVIGAGSVRSATHADTCCAGRVSVTLSPSRGRGLFVLYVTFIGPVTARLVGTDCLTITRPPEPSPDERLSWCGVAQALDEPLVVVSLDEGGRLVSRVGRVLVEPGPEALRLERPDESFGHAVVPGFAHEGDVVFDPGPSRASPGLDRGLRVPVGSPHAL
jgi:hypothetical protein